MLSELQMRCMNCEIFCTIQLASNVKALMMSLALDIFRTNDYLNKVIPFPLFNLIYKV